MKRPPLASKSKAESTIFAKCHLGFLQLNRVRKYGQLARHNALYYLNSKKNIAGHVNTVYYSLALKGLKCTIHAIGLNQNA